MVTICVVFIRMGLPFLHPSMKEENAGYLFIVLTDYPHSFLKKFEHSVGSTIKTINLNNIGRVGGGD